MHTVLLDRWQVPGVHEHELHIPELNADNCFIVVEGDKLRSCCRENTTEVAINTNKHEGKQEQGVCQQNGLCTTMVKDPPSEVLSVLLGMLEAVQVYWPASVSSMERK